MLKKSKKKILKAKVDLHIYNKCFTFCGLKLVSINGLFSIQDCFNCDAFSFILLHCSINVHQSFFFWSEQRFTLSLSVLL